jgi:hypothetical protein
MAAPISVTDVPPGFRTRRVLAVNDRDLSILLSELLEAGVARWGSVTLVVPGEGEVTVDAQELTRLADGIRGAGASSEESTASTPLRSRPFRTA